MRALWFVAFFAGLGASFSSGQQANPSMQPQLDTQPTRGKVYTDGPGVTAPELLSLDPVPNLVEKCKKKVDGKVVLSVLVDENGQPRNIMFLRPLGSDLDKLALLIVAADRFNPGTGEGKPVVVGQSVEVDMRACEDQTMEKNGRTYYLLRLRSQPVQKFNALSQPPEDAVLPSGTISTNGVCNSTSCIDHVGGSTTAPVVLISADPHYTPEAAKAGIEGKCQVTLIVDRQGVPQNIRITRSLDPGLDQNAMDAVANFRFKPSMRNGEPVAVMVSIEINFHLYH